MDDHGNSAAEATPLALGGAVTGSIEEFGDQDWFAVELTAGATYIFELLPAGSDPLQIIDFTYVAPDGTTTIYEFAWQEGAFPGEEGIVTFHVPEQTGTYFVGVDAQIRDINDTSVNDSGDYTIEVFESEPLPILFGAGFIVESVQEDPIVAGTEVTIELYMSNSGTAPAENVRIDFFLTYDDEYHPTDPILHSVTIPLIPVTDGSQIVYEFPVTLPSDIGNGMKLGTHVDPLNETRELLEDRFQDLFDANHIFVSTYPLVVVSGVPERVLTEDDDVHFGFANDETISALDGADSIAGAEGEDVLEGGGGDDTLDGGVGTDTAVFSGALADYSVTGTATTLTVSDLRAGSPDGTDTLTGIEFLRFSDGVFADGDFVVIEDRGTSGIDTITGSLAGDALSGGRQGDIIDARHGNDTVSGDEGADTLFGGAGDDLLFGGQGVDVLYGGDGRDRLDGGTGIDLMYGGDGADIFAMSSDDRIDQVRDFQAGVDRLDLSALGAIGMGDIVIADVGSWVEVSFSGAEGARAIRLFGAVSAADLGRESFLFEGDVPDAPFDPVLPIEGTDGDDTLAGTEAADTIVGLGGDDSLSGLGGDDEIDAGAGSDTLEGGAGDDLLTGGVWADLLYGGADDDTLDGGSGADVLYGGDGADRLDGGTGIDVLYGGAGADVFAYSSDTRYDRVQDFEDGLDRIDMTGFGAVAFADIAIADYGAWVALTYDAGGVVHGMYLRGPGLTAANLDAADFILS